MLTLKIRITRNIKMRQNNQRNIKKEVTLNVKSDKSDNIRANGCCYWCICISSNSLFIPKKKDALFKIGIKEKQIPIIPNTNPAVAKPLLFSFKSLKSSSIIIYSFPSLLYNKIISQ